MSLHAQPAYPIPEETRRVAKSIFPDGNLVMRMRDELGELYTDSMFGELFPKRGQPAESPGRLALVTVLQFMEGLTDRQAADAVRMRIDWKYALGLELIDTGFHYSVLSEFRARLVQGKQEQQFLDALLKACQEHGWLKARGRQRTDSTHVLGAVRQMNRLEFIGETLRSVLECLAQIAPDWLRAQVEPDWFVRYARRIENYRLRKEQSERERLAEQFGRDGAQLLKSLDDPVTPSALRDLDCVHVLRQVWEQQFVLESDSHDPPAAGQPHLRLRTNPEQPAGAQLLCSPYDPEARVSVKRQTIWLGYKVHLTETCDDDGPHLITHVETTESTTPDVGMTDTIHTALDRKALLPSEHLQDAGYTEADAIVNAKSKHGVDTCGPVHPDTGWQAAEKTGYDVSRFTFDWQKRIATCPQGHPSHTWSTIKNTRGLDAIEIRFARADCEPCPVRELCTRAKSHMRMLQIRPQAQHEAIQQARPTQTTDEFKKRYAKRAGIEGTLSQGIRAFELRRTRYIGLAKTRLQHIVIAVAINLARIFNLLEGVPMQLIRQSHFAGLAGA
jgi:transposase